MTSWASCPAPTLRPHTCRRPHTVLQMPGCITARHTAHAAPRLERRVRQRQDAAHPTRHGRVLALARGTPAYTGARLATPPTSGKHGPLPPALPFTYSRAQRAIPPLPFRTCITCSCSWDRHEKGNPHSVYNGGRAAARADAPSLAPSPHYALRTGGAAGGTVRGS